MLKMSEIVLKKNFVYLLGSLPDSVNGISLVCLSAYCFDLLGGLVVFAILY